MTKEQLMSEIIAKYEEKVTALDGIIHTQVTYGTIGTVMKFRNQVDLCDESIASLKSQLAEADEEKKNATKKSCVNCFYIYRHCDSYPCSDCTILKRSDLWQPR